VETLGDKLKSERENKGFTLAAISRDTNLPIRYLEAMEREDFSPFPGETYLIGFLRNYSDYLGLDPQEMITRYRAIRMQEQPIPMEQLLHAPSRAPRILLVFFLVLLGLGILGAGGFYIFRAVTTRPVETPARQAVAFTLEADMLERRFYRGDSVLLSLGEVQYKIAILSLREAITLSVPGSPGGQVVLDLGQEARMDLDGDGEMDLQITVEDFQRNDSESGALLLFELLGGPAAATPAETEAAAAAAPAKPGEAAQAPAQTAAPAKSTQVGPSLFVSPHAYPFTLQVSFQSYCMLRYEILAEADRRERSEQYYTKGRELSIQAQNGIRIWVNNAAAVKMQVTGGGQTKALELGSAGEVVVADLRWNRDEDGRYRLALHRLD